MGCGGSTENKVEEAEESIDKRQKISVRMGTEVKHQQQDPQIVFVFGGPGSKKGRIVDDLTNAYGFKFISMEELILAELPKKLSNIMKLTSIYEVGLALKEDPSHLTLPWIMDVLMRHIELDPHGLYLVDVMPNLKFMVRNELYLKDCKEEIKKFENRYKISFALNLAIPTDKMMKIKEVAACAHPSASDKLKAGGQSDEADSSRTQKRAALYENTAKSFLDYFASSDRLVTIDVSCGQGDFIWNRVHELLLEIKFPLSRTVNTIVLLTFDNNDAAQIDHEKYEMERVSLKDVANSPNDSVEALLSCLCKHIDSSSNSTTAFLVDLAGTSLNKDSVNKFSQYSIMYLETEEVYIESLVFSTPRHQAESVGCKPYLAICSTENEVCLFPKDTNVELCKSIALQMATQRKIH